MDYKFLNRVVVQLVNETRINRDERSVYTPFSFIYRGEMRISIWNYSHLDLGFPPHYFSQHCEEVYGLNDDEIVYVWKQYKEIILDKIENEK
jgi:hypothetical protein